MTCTFCDCHVDETNLSAQSLEIPSTGIAGEDYTVAHVGCVNREEMSPEEFNEWFEAYGDEQFEGWVIER